MYTQIIAHSCTCNYPIDRRMYLLRVGLYDNRDRSIIVLLWNYRDIGFDYCYRAIMRMRSIIVRN